MLPSPCGLRPQGRAATAPQWPLTCTIENQFVHKFFRISCKFHKYLDTILKNLETFRNNPRLTVQHVAKTSCNELQEHLWGPPPPIRVCVSLRYSLLVPIAGTAEPRCVPFPCRIGQAFSPYGRVALPDGDRWVATASDGELDPPPVRAGRRTG